MFAASLLTGALGIYVGVCVVVDHDDYTYAIVTALIGAVVWVVVAYFPGWIPFLGPLLAYVAVITARYPGGWANAVVIPVIAWLASVIVLYVLAVFEVAAFESVGVPGV